MELVACASRGLRPTERNMSNYSSMKLEFLAFKWAVTEKFRVSIRVSIGAQMHCVH